MVTMHEKTKASSAPPQPPPRITIYRNGDPHFLGKKFVVNRKYYRSFENFLDRVTSDTRSRYAIRRIHTPHNGTRVASLEVLKNGATYVAAGTERFRRIKYGSSVLKMTSSSSSGNVVRPVVHSKINAPSRHRQEAIDGPLRNRIIFLYRNGEPITSPIKLLLDKRTLRNMDLVLQYISDKVNITSGFVKAIHDKESGVKVTDVKEIQTNASYIAVGSGTHYIKSQMFIKGQMFNHSKGLSPRNNSTNNTLKVNNGKKKVKDVVPTRTLVSSSLSLPDGALNGVIIAAEKIKQNEEENCHQSVEQPVSNETVEQPVSNETVEQPVSNENVEQPVSNDETSRTTETDELKPASDEEVPEVSSDTVSGTSPIIKGDEKSEGITEENAESRTVTTPKETTPVEVPNSSQMNLTINNESSANTPVNNQSSLNSPVKKERRLSYVDVPTDEDERSDRVDLNNNVLSTSNNPSETTDNFDKEEDKDVDSIVKEDDDDDDDDDDPSGIEEDSGGTTLSSEDEEEQEAKQEQHEQEEQRTDQEQEAEEVKEEEINNEEKMGKEEESEEVPAQPTTTDEDQGTSVYKASGMQKESGDEIKDDRQTTVEKTIDMIAAAEVEEDLAQDSEAK